MKLAKRSKKNQFIITPMVLNSVSTVAGQKSKEQVQRYGKRPNKFYLKCARKRKEQGKGAILPPKIEAKIYRLKKSLIKKGIESDQIKQIVRQRRRQEELRFRKELKHVCFKCRRPGHSIANCPQSSQDDSAEAGLNICYFCGSLEHRLSDCSGYRKKQQQGGTPVLPFAECFICHQKGHLTRHCPQNEKGAFPMGGKCRRCGAVDHTFAECHMYARKNPEEAEPAEPMLTRYDDLNHGVDVDDYATAGATQCETAKSHKKKIVKF